VDNRRLLLFFVLSVAVVASWMYFFPQPARHLPPPAPAVAGESGAQGRAPGAQAAGAQVPGAGERAVDLGGGGAPAQAPAAAVAAVAGPPIGGEREEQVTLEGKDARAVFTNRGGDLVSLVVEEPGTANVELVRHRSPQGPFPFALADRRLQPLAVDKALFAVEHGADGRSVTFRYRGPAGAAEKTFRFDARGLLAADVRADGAWFLLLGPGIGNPTPDEIDNRYGQRGAVIKVGGDVQVVSSKGATEAKEYGGRTLGWAGLEDTFFAAIAVPQAGTAARAVLQPMLVEPEGAGPRFEPVPPGELTKEQKDLGREFELALEPAAGRLTLESYWGAKRYEKLKALPYGLEESVNLGSLSVVARPLLAGLHWIYDHLIGNYGWAIILMTVLIKVLLLPLTHHSTMSMRKMQVLNPRMQKIRDSYRPKLKDKQGRPNLEMQRKMNEEVMALYKSEGVNPAGGCLPLVVQMPILFAFYRLLSTSVELRHAPWLLWVQDLSARDPYFILPLIMGATQFLQVYLAPQSGDPAQRRLFLLMPWFMLVFFWAAPSGLVLYWLTNNVLTIAQQAVYNRFWKLEPAK
jgi:YidC/Oxa1 family membrane protein insertase